MAAIYLVFLEPAISDRTGRGTMLRHRAFGPGLLVLYEESVLLENSSVHCEYVLLSLVDNGANLAYSKAE